MKTTYYAIGVMSGTSVDGLDIAFCRFNLKDDNWDYKIITANTVKYSSSWIKRFLEVQNMSAVEFALLNLDYGQFIGKSVKRFINRNRIKVDLVASHGHTVMHQPHNKITLQIGSGAAIAAETGVTVVCDFRTTDVALGGQGAPLVPIGDELLFGNFDCCLNIGGFANLSYKKGDKLIAYDICAANTILSYMTRILGKEFDFNGKMAENGKKSDELLNELNQIDYYTLQPPKSLGMEWMQHILKPLNNFSTLCIPDKLRTLTEHIAMQIANAIKQSGARTTISTGGGTHNKFLVKCINSLLENSLEIPSKEIIDYKEAMIFGLLGVLRLRNENNCLKSVTGAAYDNCGGAIYEGHNKAKGI